VILLQFGLAILVIALICHIACGYWFIRNMKRRPKLLVPIAVIYLGSYLLLSVNGSYVLANHVGDHWTLSWCPPFVIVEYWVIRSHIRPTPLALVYAPLVIIDRTFVHPTVAPWVVSFKN
jgi:hypothetical protein